MKELARVVDVLVSVRVVIVSGAVQGAAAAVMVGERAGEAWGISARARVLLSRLGALHHPVCESEVSEPRAQHNAYHSRRGLALARALRIQGRCQIRTRSRAARPHPCHMRLKAAHRYGFAGRACESIRPFARIELVREADRRSGECRERRSAADED
ncbi:hypothetical protein BV20DRAFT_428384 [Pilatotrama ljubarskyi]|nr:hypothetical protein BV20DRAFT_428384 [Pilatotrama ljubarskyi]